MFFKNLKEAIEHTKFSKSELSKITQVMVNTYNGDYGSVKETLREETYHNKGDHRFITGYLVPQVFVICFRGTNGATEWKRNFNFPQSKFDFNDIPGNVKGHTGFIKSYRTIRKTLEEIIKSENPKRIIFCGHSLGAVKAGYALIDMKQTFKNIKMDYIGYGSPRMGNNEFVKYIQKHANSLLSIKNGLDIVCDVPIKLMGYSHIDNWVNLRRWKKIYAFLLPIMYKIHLIRDHYPNLYQKYVEKALKKIK